MYDIEFYEDKAGRSEVYEYIKDDTYFNEIKKYHHELIFNPTKKSK